MYVVLLYTGLLHVVAITAAVLQSTATPWYLLEYPVISFNTTDYGAGGKCSNGSHIISIESKPVFSEEGDYS